MGQRRSLSGNNHEKNFKTSYFHACEIKVLNSWKEFFRTVNNNFLAFDSELIQIKSCTYQYSSKMFWIGLDKVQ